MYAELKQVRDQMTGPDSMFAISDIEVRGQTLKTFTNAPPSLREVWALSAMGHADKTYLVYEGETWTYSQAYAESARVAAWMFENGIKQGDRVALYLMCIHAAVQGGHYLRHVTRKHQARARAKEKYHK